MNQRLFLGSLTAALAGFLLGFDTVVISGAEKTIQSLWQLGDFQHGLAMSMALWGTVVGSLLGSWPTDRFGRTKTLLSIVAMFEPGYVFGFFCFMMVLQLVWVKTMVPETKGRPLEQIEHELGMAE